MINPSEKSPSTEVMKKVIAKYKQWDRANIYRSGEHIGMFHNTERYLEERIHDPRTDLAEAMRLLAHIARQFEWHVAIGSFSDGVSRWTIEHDGSGDDPHDLFGMRLDTLDGALPLTGEPFCTAVCNLTAKVLLGEGIEG